jgi:SAM-dependent methyltransferase
VTPEHDWALALFRRSVLKQAKLEAITALLGPTEGLRCLDLGSDNGVVSLLLRRRGGDWASGDLTEEAVRSIRALVATDVHLVDGAHLPFPDASLDRAVIVDMLEHVGDDKALLEELARVVRPSGQLVVATPHLKQTLLKRFRHALGQTDEKHGHLRPGYTLAGLRRLLQGAGFDLEAHDTYARFFSELLDTAMHWGMELLGKTGSAKGIVVTEEDVKRNRKAFRAYSIVYPFAWLFSRLDWLIPWSSGYMLVARARRRLPGSPPALGSG